MGERLTILVVEDKASMAEMLKRTLEQEGYAALAARSAEEGLEAALSGGVDLVLTDLKLKGMSGMELLDTLRQKRPMLPVIMMTAFGSIELAVKAVKLGAYDFLTKPFDTAHMLVLVGRALEARRLRSENELMREQFAEELGAPSIIGRSRALAEAVGLVRKAAPTRATVLITGESGTGKELFARAIHHLSPRADGPFVPINCAAIPRDLLESELFGHEKGSFTGADARRLGKFELADRGTVFLDEVGEMDLGLQAKLLRVLEDGLVERVGSAGPVKVDVRVVAASNRDLGRAVSEGAFREDLYYRLNVFPIRIPPLRERAEDVPLLAAHFVEKYARELKRSVPALSGGALALLSAQQWRGNVRELENCMERAVIMAGPDEITPEHLGLAGGEPRPCPAPGAGGGGVEPLQAASGRAARAAEEMAIRAALAACDGNKTRAADMLKVSYKTLLTKIKDYNIV